MSYFSSNHQPSTTPDVGSSLSTGEVWRIQFLNLAPENNPESFMAFSVKCKVYGSSCNFQPGHITHMYTLEMMNWKKKTDCLAIVATGVVTFMECIYHNWLAASSNFKIELPTISPTQKIETCSLVVHPFAAHFISKECCLFWSEIPNCKTFGKAVLPGRHWPVHTPVEEDDVGWFDRHSIGPFQNPNNKG